MATNRLTRGLALHSLLLLLWSAPGWPQEGWQAEFEDACSKTDVAMTLSVDELERLLARCDRLQGVIAAQEETARKVYLKRLEMCRNLYRFVLDGKKGKQGQPG